MQQVFRGLGATSGVTHLTMQLLISAGSSVPGLSDGVLLKYPVVQEVTMVILMSSGGQELYRIKLSISVRQVWLQPLNSSAM